VIALHARRSTAVIAAENAVVARPAALLKTWGSESLMAGCLAAAACATIEI